MPAGGTLHHFSDAKNSNASRRPLRVAIAHDLLPGHAHAMTAGLSGRLQKCPEPNGPVNTVGAAHESEMRPATAFLRRL